MERPELLEKAERFATYSVLMFRHFLDDNYLQAANIGGNEHRYWMCYSGVRDINKQPGIQSISFAGKSNHFTSLFQ